MNDLSNTGPRSTTEMQSMRPVFDCVARFWSKFDLKVGTTNVVTFPKKFQEAMENSGEKKLVLVPIDPEELPYWRLYTFKAFDELVQRIKNNLEMEEESRSYAWQKLVSDAIHFDLDSQGRFSLDKTFIDEKLKHVEVKSIVMEGKESCINIWAKSDYDAELARLETLKKTSMKNVMKSVFKL